MDYYRLYDEDPESSETEAEYRATAKRKRLLILAALLATVAMVFITIFVSNLRYGAIDALIQFFTFDRFSQIGKFVWNIDLPVLIQAFAAGAGLSVAGTIMQCILRNPLASPYTLGLSNAAAFGAATAIIFGGTLFTGTVLAQFALSGIAFVMSMVAVGIILALVKLTRISPETLVLAGIAVSAIFSAGLTLMQYLADSAQLSQIVSWMFGQIQLVKWGWVGVIFSSFVLVFVFCMLNRWTLNAVEQGDDVAKGLGVNTDRFMIIGLVISSILAALIVSQFGIIAFVGLLGPHMARMLVGSDHRYLVPMSALMGGLLLMVANLVAGNILLPEVLPVGLLTALLGGPVFVYLLIRRYRA